MNTLSVNGQKDLSPAELEQLRNCLSLQLNLLRNSPYANNSSPIAGTIRSLQSEISAVDDELAKVRNKQ